MFTGQIEKRFSHGLAVPVLLHVDQCVPAGRELDSATLQAPSPQQFLPGSVPTDFNALNKFLNYQRDTGVPKHRVRWNFIYDLPFGHNRQFAANAPKWLNAMIGGWSMTGSGTIVSTWFALDSSDWGFTGAPVQVYGTKYPIEDCTATPASAKTPQDVRCYNGYYYWNGYISPKLINSKNAYGMPNGIEGLPANVRRQ